MPYKLFLLFFFVFISQTCQNMKRSKKCEDLKNLEAKKFYKETRESLYPYESKNHPLLHPDGDGQTEDTSQIEQEIALKILKIKCPLDIVKKNKEVQKK